MKYAVKRLCSLFMILCMMTALLTACGTEGEKLGADADTQDKKKPDTKVKIVEIELTKEQYGIGVDKSQPELLKSVNDFLARIKGDGTLEDIIERHLTGGDIEPVISAEQNSERDQLLMASTLDFEPFVYGKEGEYYGIDYEIGKLLAEDLGKELVIVNATFETMMMSVQQGKCDVCIAGITITDERKKNMNFSDPYYDVSQELIVKSDDMEFDNITKKKELLKYLNGKDKTTTIGVENLTIAQYYCDGNPDYGFPGLPMTVKRYRNAEDAVEGLLDGECDYVMIDSTTGRILVDRANGAR